MKIKELLFESPFDLVAGYYKEATKDYDQCYNGEATLIAKRNKEYYEEYFKEWFEDGVVPVFEKPVLKAQPSYDHNPKKGQSQSPGYRGKQYALSRARPTIQPRCSRIQSKNETFRCHRSSILLIAFADNA